MSRNLTIGFIGTGVMGKSMIQHLQQAGYSIHIHTRTKTKALELIQKGAIWKDTVKELAKTSDVIITMVGYPSDVEEVYFGSNGIIENAKSGAYIIDMTTSKPSLAVEIYSKAKERNLYALDAPVSGGDIGAKNGTLAIMVGGDEKAFSAMLPIFEKMGNNIILQGDAGAGQYTKLVNQIVIASTMIGVTEAIAFARKAGLNPEQVLESISTGAAGSHALTNLVPRMLKEDFEPGFYVKHFIKDMTIALEAGKEMGLTTPGLELSLNLYKELAERGEEDSGTQALIKLFEQL